MDTQEPTQTAAPQNSEHTTTQRQTPTQVEQHSVLRPLTPKPTQTVTKKGAPMKKSQPAIIGVLIVILGIISGYSFAVVRNGGSATGLKNEPGLKREVSSGEITKGTKVGVADEKTFKDSAEGLLEKGGIDGEGSHHITRPGGETQTVYITSSVIDLDQFINRKVKVWGETMAADKAGWFMDVGKLEVLE